jgi:hypothetical protein
MAVQEEQLALADFQPFNTIKCQILDTDYVKAVCEVWQSIKANEKWFAFKGYTYETVERVLSAYMDVQKDPLQPELNFAANRTTTEINANTRLVNQVSTNAGVDVDTTLKVLEQLYYASQEGRISNMRVLFPRRFAQEGDPRNETSTIEKTLKIAAGVAVGIGVAVGLFYAARAYKIFSSSSPE